MGNTIGKILTLAFWLAAAYNLIAPFPGAASTAVNWIALILLLAHSVECIVFTPKIREHHTNPITGYVLVLLFGVLHSGQWMKKSKPAG